MEKDEDQNQLHQSMKKYNTITSLEENILFLQQETKYMPVSIGEIVHIFPGKGRLFVLLLLSLPFCQPLQIPGLSTPFGLVIAFISLRMAFGKRMWIPKKIASKVLPAHLLQKILSKALVLIKKTKRWVYPRIYWVCHASPMKTINALTITFLGLLLALPLPIPFSNLTAAWAIFLMAFGILNDDGAFVLIGYLISIITMVFFVIMGLMLTHIL